MLSLSLQDQPLAERTDTWMCFHTSDTDPLSNIVAELVLKNQAIRFQLTQAKAALRLVERFLLDSADTRADGSRLQQILATVRLASASVDLPLD